MIRLSPILDCEAPPAIRSISFKRNSTAFKQPEAAPLRRDRSGRGSKSGAIIIVTAKPKLDDKDAEALTAAQEKSGGKIKFYAFVIGNTDNAVLKMFVTTSGGQYRLVSDKDLRAATP